jgi:hypothetical protein
MQLKREPGLSFFLYSRAERAMIEIETITKQEVET